MKRLCLAIPTLALSLAAAQAHAGFWTFNSALSGLNEVPPNSSPAIGNTSGNYNDVTNVLNITTWGDLFSTAVTGAHIHGPAAPGVNAGILISLGLGSDLGYDYYTVNQFVLTPTQEGYFLAGLTYVNIHTQQIPGGEIRGQLNPVPEPATMLALGLGVASVAAVRRRRRTA